MTADVRVATFYELTGILRYDTAMIWERTNQQHTEKYVNLLADIKRIQKTYTPLAQELNQTMEEFVRDKDQFMDEATPEQRLRLFRYIEEIKKATTEKEKEFDIWQKVEAKP